MPVPSPKGNESKSKYVSRCIEMLNGEKNDFSDKQKAAMCYNRYKQWQDNKNPKKKNKSKAKIKKSRAVLDELKKLQNYYNNNYHV